MSFMKISKGKPLFSIPNGLGEGAYFDGSSSYADLSDSNLPMGNSARSISLWFNKTNKQNEYTNLIRYGTEYDNYSYSVGINDSGCIETYGCNNTLTYNNEPITLGKWYHVVITFNTDYTEQCYLNGVLVGTQTHNGINTHAEVLCLGNWYGVEWFQGNLKDLNVYNRVLSAEEVTTLYNKGTVTDGLVLNIPLQYGEDDESIFSSKSFVYDYSILTTSSGFDEWGYPIRYDIASEAGIAYGQIEVVTPVNPTSNIWEDWAISASTELDSPRPAYKAFTEDNDDENGCWHSTNSYPQWLQWYNVNKSIKITQYSITNRNGSAGANILTWELQGSNDLQTWDTLDSRNRESTQDSATETFEVAKDKQQFYKYHRIYITRSDNGYSTIGNLIALGTIK